MGGGTGVVNPGQQAKLDAIFQDAQRTGTVHEQEFGREATRGYVKDRTGTLHTTEAKALDNHSGYRGPGGI